MPRTLLLGAVLAGGRSIRMGRCKAELPHESGGTFLDHALEQLAACCDHVACSLAADAAEPTRGSVSSTGGNIADRSTIRTRDGESFQDIGCSANPLPPGVVVIVDEVPDRGPVEGVCGAVELANSLGCAGVLVTAVDMPALNATHLQHLISVFSDAPDRVVVAISDDVAVKKRIQPLVAIYPVALQGDLQALAGSAHRSLYRFLEGVDCCFVELPAGVLHNVNSPHDLRV
ncbi:molybdenum cofactor guanylyltransferase [Allorhodopirellula heiligendammensis]|uniref:Molybdopterin-guanine dinucleotide biosynthesis protein MobA n=1 Tax=Allorhodopirellula heiligendammensis TaxID=2714739 RepID=A0A5C6BW15_9BACT|nr:molybdenum cofactor guanylyltransferase [Allorhodopirellula heiligendammensis]TWU16480.1 molybdopterin-guanine dinucleotide biosynthesis protein MobA [Allorhodopirellula heiligendammensis]